MLTDPLASGGPPSLRKTGEMVGLNGLGKSVVIPRWMLLVGLLVGQALLARFMSQIPAIGLLQAVVLLAIGGWAILGRNLMLGLQVIVYLPGAEIAWRQAHAPVPNFAAPYTAILIALAGTALVLRAISRPGRFAVFYFALLVPSMLVTISSAGPTARQAIAFGLVGPLTLMAMVILVSQVVVEPWYYTRLLWTLVIGGMGPLAIALTAINDTVSAEGAIDFRSSSNFVTAGGFGPVQVSSIMGLTAVAAVLLVLAEREAVPRALAAGMALLATVQSFLTFSRGGMFAAAIALGALAISQATSREGRRKVIVVVGLTFAVGYFLVVPRVDSYTEGAFKERFSTTQTGRTGLASDDLKIFEQNLAFGVGPGMSKYSRIPFELCQLRSDKCKDEGSSHTEFTRMLSEHGLAGLAAIGVFIAIALQALRRSGTSRSICVTFLAWAIAQMFYANMRVAGIAIVFGLAFLRVQQPPPDPLEELISPQPVRP